jgi:hypothetical protein
MDRECRVDRTYSIRLALQDLPTLLVIFEVLLKATDSACEWLLSDCVSTRERLVEGWVGRHC